MSCAAPLIAQRAGGDFDGELARLRAGRTYKPQPAGVREVVTIVNNTRLDNIVEVPEGCQPHSRTAEITLHPRGWDTTQWWHAAQVENVFKLLARVKADYNVDESRTYLTGISDGGTGVYFLAMRAATPWASCLPLNGHPAVLENPQTGTDGELFCGNLVNCPLHRRPHDALRGRAADHNTVELCRTFRPAQLSSATHFQRELRTVSYLH